jgi:hypothetical protein
VVVVDQQDTVFHLLHSLLVVMVVVAHHLQLQVLVLFVQVVEVAEVTPDLLLGLVLAVVAMGQSPIQ